MHREQLKAVEDWAGLTREQINASRTVQQVKANIRQLEQTRTCVCDDDLAQFDASLADIQKQTVAAVVDFLADHDLESGQLLSDHRSPARPVSVRARVVNGECKRIC